MHESTVSRVAAGKYLACDQGCFDFRFFFSSAIQAVSGGEAFSAAAVQERIRGLVQAEPRPRTLSDDKIVALLNDEGIDIARRTVAKYREGMGIPSSVERRRLRNSLRSMSLDELAQAGRRTRLTRESEPSIGSARSAAEPDEPVGESGATHAHSGQRQTDRHRRGPAAATWRAAWARRWCKYFDRPVEAVVTFSKDGHVFVTDCSVHLATGMTVQATARADEIYASFEGAVDRMEKQLRRYKRRLKDHHRDRQDPIEAIGAPSYILAGGGDDARARSPPACSR